MSQVHQENAEVPDEELSNSSETSSSSSCTTTSATTPTTKTTTTTKSSTTTSSSSSSSNGSTSDSGSDNDGDIDTNLHRHRHRQCQKSKSHSSGDPGGNPERDLLNVRQAEVIDRLKSTTGHMCDNRTTMTNRPGTTKSEVHAKSHCECYPKNETTSPPLLSTSPSLLSTSPPQHQTTNKPLETHDTQKYLDKSATSDRRLLQVADEQNSKHDRHHNIRYHLSTNPTSLGSSYSNLSSTTSTLEPTNISETSRRTLKPAPSPSPSLSNIDTNNNKNNNSSSRDGLSSIKRTNFSKSASGSRLVNRGRSNVCDCLSQDCEEKKHSNRRQFIEHYYNSRTQLPTANTSTSSFNISTPLNRLSECDAITKRLLSSPIRTTNLVESPTHRAQVSDLEKSRRASLGTNTMTDQVFLFSSNPFKLLELSHRKNRDNSADNQQKCDLESANSSGENDIKLKQQQGRSLSVCDEETLNPRLRGTSSNHSPNLNRATSLACESGPSTTARRLLTIIPLFGCDIKSLEQFTKLGMILPPVIDSAVDHILVNGINSIGIFRKSGVKSRILTLRQRIEADQNMKFDELNQNNEFSIYDIADLVKMWFRELKPVPLMTKELIKLISAFLNTSPTTPFSQPQTTIKRGNSSQQDIPTATSRSNTIMVKYPDPSLKNRIDSMITPTRRALLLRALNFLAQISSRCGSNQMTSQNLAICLTPSLCATESDQSSILLAQKALEYCIDNHRILFGRSNIG